VQRTDRGPASLYAASNSGGRETEISYYRNKRFVCGGRCRCVILSHIGAATVQGSGLLRMKIPGILLLLAGWFLVLSSLVLIRATVARASFVLAGIAVELLGLGMLFRSHLVPRRRPR
jgi:hypothetical protein